jgi:hypothetical protein
VMCSAGFAHTGLTHGLSRMTGNCHVRFLGEGAAAMPLPYPTAEVGCGGCEPSFKRLQVAPGLSSRFLTGPARLLRGRRCSPFWPLSSLSMGGMSAV